MVKITNIKNVAIATVALTLSEAFGQSMLRVFFDKGLSLEYWYLPFIAWLMYGLCCAILLWSYKYSDLSAVETLWDAGTSVLVPLVSVLFFKGSLNWTSGMGILVTIVGIMLIGKGGVKAGKK
jgi:multidrug transporter EmrE-like cation transporter